MPTIKFTQEVNMQVPGGCGALGNDTSSQLAIILATAFSMGINSTYIFYSGCSKSKRRNLKSVSTSIPISATNGIDFVKHLLGSTSIKVQSVSVNTDIVIPLPPSSFTASEAQSLYASLTSQIAAAFSLGNFTRTLKAASVALGATVTAKVNATSLGSTSALVLVFPPTSAPTNSATPTFAPILPPQSSSSSSVFMGLPFILGVSVGGFLIMVVFITAYMYECHGKSEDDSTTTGGRVQKVILHQQQKKMIASLKVRPLVSRSILEDGGAAGIITVRKNF
jgi:hypothetical protein